MECEMQMELRPFCWEGWHGDGKHPSLLPHVDLPKDLRLETSPVDQSEEVEPPELGGIS